MLPRALLFTLALLFLQTPEALADWDLSKASIPIDAIRSGGPPKDGIPALLEPKFISAAKATFLHDDDTVIGFAWKGEAKAYPLRIMSWHESVNDRLADHPFLVSWWPLSHAGVVYDRVFKGSELTFGVSGMLWNSNVLLYDHQSESLWSQVRGGAVTGPKTGTRLRAYPSTVTSWKKWRRKYPDTLVLSTDTGHRRDYSRDPYESYYRERGAGLWRLFTPGLNEEEKELVAGLEFGGEKKAYPVEVIRTKGELTDTLGGTPFTLSIDRQTGVLSGKTGSGEEFAPTVLYWFVWKAAHPDTGVYGKD